ncbi:MAG: hypothetical protein V4580_17960 [Bacteroidota bacterium]
MPLNKNIIIILLFGLFSFSGHKNRIEIIPGFGIVINRDTIIINKHSSKDILKVIKIKDTFKPVYVHWDGYDKTGMVYGDYIKKTILFKEIEFEFEGTTEDSLFLKIIFIQTIPSKNSLLLSKNIFTDTSTSVINRFPNSVRSNLSDENASKFGITFQLETANERNRLKKISIHEKFSD